MPATKAVFKGKLQLITDVHEWHTHNIIEFLDHLHVAVQGCGDYTNLEKVN